MALIKCPECGKEVSSAASSCPHCGHPISAKKETIVVEKQKKKGSCLSKILFFIVFFILVGFGLGMITDEEENEKNSTTVSQNKEQEEIVYTKCSVTEMVDLLNENAMKAEDTYKGKYLEITGRLDVIDSNGSYISLYPENEVFALTGVQCSIKNDEQKQKVMEMSKGDIVTLKGKCKSVGELLGYTLDIKEIL